MRSGTNLSFCSSPEVLLFFVIFLQMQGRWTRTSVCSRVCGMERFPRVHDRQYNGWDGRRQVPAE